MSSKVASRRRVKRICASAEPTRACVCTSDERALAVAGGDLRHGGKSRHVTGLTVACAGDRSAPQRCLSVPAKQSKLYD
jgi:hypothetical protein